MRSLLIITLLFCGTLRAQDSLQFLGWTDGAACFSIDEYNDYLYTGNGNTFSVYHAVGNPPYTETYRYKFLSNIDDIQHKGSTLYICANHSGVSKWDISNPATPQLIAEYKPADPVTEAAYDISFYGTDTLFVTYKTKVAVFQDQGSSLNLLTTFGTQPTQGRIRGGAVKDTLFAYTVGMTNGAGNDGIYIVDAQTLNPISYWPQTWSEPEEILFSEGVDMLNVLGGTNSWNNPFDAFGAFYSLDISDPYNPTEVFFDTVKTIWGLGIAAPMNGVNINDTLYIATNAAMKPGFIPLVDPTEGQIYVYDVTDTGNVHFITSIYGGLWHFDCLVQDDTLLQIASEWYGVETVDISDLFNPVQLGKTLTGGWNWGSGVKGDTMVVCNGGYGFKVFDISNPTNPVQTHVSYDTNFVKTAEFSADGQYLYVWFLTNDGLRVYDANTYTQVGSLAGFHGDQRSYRYNDMLICQQWPSIGVRRIHFTDITTPTVPTVALDTQYNANDYFVDEVNGKMFLAHNDELAVWDLDNNFSLLASDQEPGIFINFKAVTAYQDTVFAFATNKGLIRYIYDGANSLVEDTVITLPDGEPKFMAADRFGLYLCYVEEGLFSYNKSTMVQTDFYEHGREFVTPNQWGPRDLFCKNDLIFLGEWYGQTTILTHENGVLSVLDQHEPLYQLRLAPNPSNQQTVLSFQNPNNLRLDLNIFSSTGKIIQTLPQVKGSQVTIDTHTLPAGIYFCVLSDPQGRQEAVRLVVE